MSTRTAAAYPPRPEATLAASKVRSASRPIVRTALALLSAQGLSWLTSLLSILFIPRFLGASDYGLYASVQTGVFLLIAIATFGTTNHIVKSVARAPSHTSNIVLHAALGRLGIWSLFFVGALFLGPLLLGTGRTYSVLIAMVAGAAFHLLM
ncbi:MAG TPA: oligosaccharide flippase family protein, partial [Dehalococcoidia bacterium]|nr:oligosaccharide flippase family protein [Dehalococcoidia bacterium]